MDMFRVQLVLFGILCAGCGVESQDSSITVTARPASGTVVTGVTYTMHCEYRITETSVTQVRVEWYKRRPGGTSVRVWSTEVSSSGDVFNQAESGYPRLSGSAATFSALQTGHSLTITDVQREDGGEYRCRVIYWQQDGSSKYDDSPEISLVVEASPSPILSVFRYNDSGKAVIDDNIEGEKAIVQCSSPLTTPADNVTLTIYNGSQPMSSYRADTGDRYLCRAEVTFSRSDNHAGDWWCTATLRGQDYDSTKLSVDVKFTASSVSMVQPFPSDAVALGTRVSAECATDSANPTPVIIWRISSVAIQYGDIYSIVPEERDGEYNAKYRTSTLSFVAAQEHAGRQFDCVIQDQLSVMPAGSTLQLKANLQVQIHGYSGPLHVGETLSLTCTTGQDGDNPTFTWTFTQGGQNVVSYDKTYTKQSVQSSDAGDYTCEASTDNAAGKVTITVVVQGAISPTPVPTIAPPPIQTMTTTSKSQTPSSLTTLDSQQTTATDGLNRNGGDANESSSNTGVIAGAAGGGGALIIIIIIVIVVCVMRRKKAASKAPEQELASLRNNTPNVENGQSPSYFGQEAKDKKPQTAVKPSRNTARDSLKKETGKGGSTTPLDQSMERGGFAARLGQMAKELDKGGPVLKSTPSKPESGAASVNPEPFYAQPDLTGRWKKEPVPNTPKADDDDESPDESPDVPNKLPGISKPAVAVKPMAQQQQEKKDKKNKAVNSAPTAKPEPEPNEYYNTAQVTAQRTNDKLEQTSLDTDGQMYAEVMTPTSKSVIKPIGQQATEYSAVQFRPGSPGEESDTDSD